MEWSIHEASKKIQPTVRKTKRLKQWILKTTSSHLQLGSCDPIEPISHWYKALKTQQLCLSLCALYAAFEQKILAGAPSQSWKYFVRFPEILILLCVLITKDAWTNAVQTESQPSASEPDTQGHLHPSVLTHCEVISPLAAFR